MRVTAEEMAAALRARPMTIIVVRGPVEPPTPEQLERQRALKTCDDVREAFAALAEAAVRR